MPYVNLILYAFYVMIAFALYGAYSLVADLVSLI